MGSLVRSSVCGWKVVCVASTLFMSCACASWSPKADNSRSSSWGSELLLATTVPALFVFGDSTVDVGNNNYLTTLAQATFWPYGKDFDTHQPTGRFCDGRLTVDYIASFLGLPFVPPYLQSLGSNNFEKGVNFASAGSGILQDTGLIFGEFISFTEQLNNFKTVKEILVAQLGPLKAAELIADALYYISTGSNDFINNYLLPVNPHTDMLPDDFQQLLIVRFTEHIQTLFSMGARKIVVASLSPLGCIPSQLYKMNSTHGECIEHVNQLALDFNSLLADRLHFLRRHLSGVMLTYNDVYLAFRNIIDHPTINGFKHINESCCGAGAYGGMKSCLIWSTVCANASDHLFWDEFHLTEAAYKIIADTFWSGPIQVSSPWNVKTLASMARL